MSRSSIHERIRRDTIRCICLCCLVESSGAKDSEAILRYVAEVINDVDFVEIRRHLDYLEMKKMVSILRRPNYWAARIDEAGFNEADRPARPGYRGTKRRAGNHLRLVVG